MRVLLQDHAASSPTHSVDVAVRFLLDPRRSDHLVRGSVVLPHGTGKAVRVAVFAKGDDADLARQHGEHSGGWVPCGTSKRAACAIPASNGWLVHVRTPQPPFITAFDPDTLDMPKPHSGAAKPALSLVSTLLLPAMQAPTSSVTKRSSTRSSPQTAPPSASTSSLPRRTS